ncbi:HAD family hydrolase [Pectinatus frisingensis]|jgi:Cof subfamily protein (haloacid dehalogenase superfamily)|uniref:HAD family hydrolase n=1 Tax=Pectinatus frisingensis TaxID=865 RepID=UPI0015F4D959|nr:HAD family hydrolase [Pectinatus frisingensis]
MIKWIISDMDGTLLDDNGQLPVNFDDTIIELKKRGIIFSPASGRQYYALTRQFSRYKDDWLFIAENGTMVVHGNELLSYTSLPDNLTAKLIATATSLKGVYVVVCTCSGSYVISENAAFFAEMGKYYTNYKIINDFYSIKDPIIKISICDCDNRNMLDTAHAQLAAYQDKVQLVMATHIWLDIMPKGMNKGIAIQKMQKKLHIKPEECMAFGDFYNDLEMLESVGESYAMENAIPELKAVAKHIAPTNSQGGVIKVIREYLQKN